jgi:hypothetical protein
MYMTELRKNRDILMTVAAEAQYLKFRPSDYEVDMLPSWRQDFRRIAHAFFTVVTRKVLTVT